MTFLKLSLAAAVLTAAATPALAGDSENAFNNFQKICGATSADYATAVAAADADGWKPSQVVGDNGMPKVTISQKAARGKTVGAQNLLLFASFGLAQTPGGALSVSDCTVRSDTGDLATLESHAQTWLGFAPATTASDRATYRFTTDGKTLKAVADADANAAVAAGGLEVLTISRGGSNSLTLDLIKIKK